MLFSEFSLPTEPPRGQICVDQLFAELENELIDLLDYKIYPYNYSQKYPEDDKFLDIIEILLRHDTVIFATPVYWYSMSGMMKTLFDRFTDLVTINKEHGRQLKGKRTFLVTVGTDNELPDGFEVPFRQTSDYLNMKFISTYYCRTTDLTTELSDKNEIIEKIKGPPT